MSRNRRPARSGDSATGQRTMGDFVSRPGVRGQVEIIDDEDDEIEEINTVSVKIGQSILSCIDKWPPYRILGLPAKRESRISAY